MSDKYSAKDTPQGPRYGIFEVQNFHFSWKDPKDFHPAKSLEDARQLAVKTLKSEDHCMSYKPTID